MGDSAAIPTRRVIQVDDLVVTDRSGAEFVLNETPCTRCGPDPEYDLAGDDSSSPQSWLA